MKWVMLWKDINGHEIDGNGYNPVMYDDQVKISENTWSVMNCHGSHDRQPMTHAWVDQVKIKENTWSTTLLEGVKLSVEYSETGYCMYLFMSYVLSNEMKWLTCFMIWKNVL